MKGSRTLYKLSLFATAALFVTMAIGSAFGIGYAATAILQGGAGQWAFTAGSVAAAATLAHLFRHYQAYCKRGKWYRRDGGRAGSPATLAHGWLTAAFVIADGLLPWLLGIAAYGAMSALSWGDAHNPAASAILGISAATFAWWSVRKHVEKRFRRLLRVHVPFSN
jgi:membrane protein implicated in regulation of membrane protease activity